MWQAPKKEKAPPPSSKPAKSGGGKQKKKVGAMIPRLKFRFLFVIFSVFLHNSR